MPKREVTARTELPMFIMLLLISFASVNAVLFTPALPDIVDYFGITDGAAQLTVTLFLAGYALGQLIYGPLANRLGRKRSIYIGVIIQIFSSLICVLSGLLDNFPLLVAARFVLAIGSGVGLKVSITMLNEFYPPQIASRKMSLLMLAFAVAPGLGVALGGVLNTYWGWMSCFYACALYGIIMLCLTPRLPETQAHLKLNALKLNYLLKAYSTEFSNLKIIAGGFLVGMSSCYIYLFASLAPFIAIEISGMNSEQYGFANLIPMFGLGLGSIISAKLTKYYPILSILKMGLFVTMSGVILMTLLIMGDFPILISLFLPMILVNMGGVMILANSSTIAMGQAKDMAHGASVINFIAVGLSTIAVLSVGFFNIKLSTLPAIFGLLCSITLFMYWVLKKPSQ